jgi:hypothetical protein
MLTAGASGSKKSVDLDAADKDKTSRRRVGGGKLHMLRRMTRRSPQRRTHMARRHLLQGLMQWLTREQWRERFEAVLDEHLRPTCDETGLEVDDIAAILGEEFFMSTVRACSFEDLLTREFTDGGNIVDDYLKRRGWKESASVRAYMAALRSSQVSLYEVSDVVRDSSFRARDLVRGGEPMLISERSATRSLKQWDRIAARVVQVGSQMQISGAVLPYQHAASEKLLGTLRRFGELTGQERQELLAAIGQDFDDAIDGLSQLGMLRVLSPMFTTFWLLDQLDRAGQPEVPDLRNAEGDEFVLHTVRYPLAADTTHDDVRAALEQRPELRREGSRYWNWVAPERPGARPIVQEQSRQSLTFETTLEDGALVLGGVELEDEVVVLRVNSKARSELGCTLLSKTLGGRVGQPSIEKETVEQIMASRDAVARQALDIPEETRRTIIHDRLDRHYRDMLDQPIPMLGDRSPRAAVKTAQGRIKVVDWLKMIENHTAKSANNVMADYSLGWLWTELGVTELRR